MTLVYCEDMPAASVGKLIKQIATAISSSTPHHIYFPDQQETHAITNNFSGLHNYLESLGVLMQLEWKSSPGGEDAERY